MDRKTFLHAAALGTWAMSTPAQGETEGWELRLEHETRWRPATVPGCWERDGVPGANTGPVWYRHRLSAPPAPKGTRLWCELDAVSYHCEGFADARSLGEHTGLWDAFAWEVPGGTKELTLRVEKPGAPRFPVKQTLAGFLPYVWGTWGGPWQEVRLRRTGAGRIARVWASGDAKGSLLAEADLDLLPGTTALVEFLVTDADERPVARGEASAPQSGTVRVRLAVVEPALWSSASPTCYQLTVSVVVQGALSDRKTRTVGFRTVAVEGERVLLNGEPIYFRAPLSWGWYESAMAPNPAPGVFEEELKRIRQLGFNGVKLCLWVPPESYFALADRLGMLLWVELPLWLPETSAFFTRQTPVEYARLIRQIGDHPSIVLWTLGCELGQGIDAAFLATLYQDLKQQTGSPLVRDNSGSAECYGGPLPEHADYWDFHLYCDLPFARPTFDAFAPRWRERQPFFFGEFNDQDALRDLPAILRRQKEAPWWTRADPQHNPQGVRWEYAVTQQAETLEKNGLLPRLAELKESSAKQALLARKHTLELTRSYPFTSGYVVTGLVDTPISTAGLYDDLGALRYDPTAFNGDTVLFIEPDRRRAWTAGGDRPAWLDRWGARAGEPVRRHVGVSHYGKPLGPGAILRWKTSSGQSGEWGLGPLATGDVRALGLVEFAAPSAPQKLMLTVELVAAGKTLSSNAWPLWVFAAPKDGGTVELWDPGQHLAGFEDATGWRPAAAAVPGASGRVVATDWRPELLALAQQGGRVLYLQPTAQEGLPAVGVPFYREAMRLFEEHPSWGSFPHEKSTDFLFYGMATDTAFDPERVRQALGVELTPVLTRVDARTSQLHSYIAEVAVGTGRLLITTLRPYGGLGDQPSGLTRAVCGAGLLRAWLEWLAH